MSTRAVRPRRAARRRCCHRMSCGALRIVCARSPWSAVPAGG